MARFPKSTEVQSLLFLRDKWTAAAAKKWLSAHGYKTPAVDKTADYYRYRQSPPFNFRKGTFRTIVIGPMAKGIKAVIAVPRETKKNPSNKSGYDYTRGEGEARINTVALRRDLEKRYNPFLVPKYFQPYLKWLKDTAWEYDDFNLKFVKSGPIFKAIPGANNTKKYLESWFRSLTFGDYLRINTPYADYSKPRKIANPSKKQTKKRTDGKKPWVPTLLVDLADAKSIDLEGGEQLKFPFSGNWAMCATRSGRELWIVSRKGGKNVRTTDKKGEDLYEDFTGFEHDPTGKMIHINPKNMIRIGRAMDIVYRSDKFSRSGDSSDYIHTFKAYPTVSVDNVKRPKIVALRGGRIRVTKEGIKG